MRYSSRSTRAQRTGGKGGKRETRGKEEEVRSLLPHPTRFCLLKLLKILFFSKIFKIFNLNEKLLYKKNLPAGTRRNGPSFKCKLDLLNARMQILYQLGIVRAIQWIRSRDYVENEPCDFAFSLFREMVWEQSGHYPKYWTFTKWMNFSIEHVLHH